jgi:hypothetical protein
LYLGTGIAVGRPARCSKELHAYFLMCRFANSVVPRAVEIVS